MIDTALLEQFVAVARLRNFSRAADALNVTQPVVSRSMKRLEDLIGTALIVRTTRSMALTPAGDALLRDAIDILGRLAVAKDEARRIGDGLRAEVRVAICPTVEAARVVRGIKAFRERWPDVTLKLEALMSDLQPEALRASHVDVGVITGGAPGFKTLRWCTLAKSWLGLAVPLAWDFPADRPVELKALADRPLLLPQREKAPPWYDGIMDMCNSAGFRPRIGGFVEEPVIARIMVASGMGAMFVPSRGEAKVEDEIQFLPLAGEPVYISGETIVAWDEGATAPPIGGLVECLTKSWDKRAI